MGIGEGRILLKKDQIFMVGKTKVIITQDTIIDKEEMGYFILNFWEQCDVADINVFPVVYVSCANEQEVYELFKSNIIYGGAAEICLI
ncbi:MAG: hypothetical protein IJD58_00090 [Lachnospiraceae bacterium]|nr:hypothetical protein [Lachnospiraceae bacterium]